MILYEKLRGMFNFGWWSGSMGMGGATLATLRYDDAVLFWSGTAMWVAGIAIGAISAIAARQIHDEAGR